MADGLDLVRLRLTAVLEEGARGREYLEAWEQACLVHGEATRYELPQDVLVTLGTELTEMDQTLRRCRAAASLRRLARVTAQLSGLACLLVVRRDDLGDFRQWARTAVIAATEAGDAETLSWVLAQEAYGHFYAGHQAEAVSVARHARELMRRRPCAGAASAAALEARAHAARGDLSQARRALGRAETIPGMLTPGQMTASASGYTEAQFRFRESSACTRLGQVRAAVAAQDRALALCAPGDYTDRALTMLDRATCLARQGDPVAAVEYAAAMLRQLAPEQRQGLIALRGAELAGSLPAVCRSAPAARELRELLHASAPAGRP